MLSKKGDSAATKSDLKTAVKVLRTDLKADIDGARSELKADIDGVRSELKADITRVAVEVVKTNARIDALDQKLSKKFDDHSDHITGLVDAFTKRIEADNRAIVLHGQILIEHSEKLKAQGHRLEALEA